MSRRNNSGSKWKEVLGFDDGSSEISSVSGRRSVTSSARMSRSSASTAPSLYTPQPVQYPYEHTRLTYPRFPRDITFFRSKGDILLSPSSPAPSPNDLKPLPAPPPLFYITVQKDPLSTTGTARPDIILHAGPSKAETIICFAKFHSVTTATEMTLCPPAPKSISANFSSADFNSAKSSKSSTSSSWAEREAERPRFQFETLQSTGGIFTTEKYTFSHTNPRTGVREKFEWRNSSRSFIKSFDQEQDTGGLKLIRSRTGDVLAVYAGLATSRSRNPSRVVGMFRFLRGDPSQGLGEEFEVLAVVSLLAIVERARRTLKQHQLAFG